MTPNRLVIRKESDAMTINEFIRRALEYEPMTETTAQKILRRILLILGLDPPKGLPEPEDHSP